MQFNPFVTQRPPFCDINMTHSFTYSRIYVKDLSGVFLHLQRTVLSILKIKSGLCYYTKEKTLILNNEMLKCVFWKYFFFN